MIEVFGNSNLRRNVFGKLVHTMINGFEGFI